MNRADTVGASWDTILMLDFLFFFSIPTLPDGPGFYNLAHIGMNRGDSWPESWLCNWGFKPQLHCHDFGPRQSYDSPRFVKSGCIGMILSSAVAPSWCTGVNRSSTVVILEESWWFGNLEDNATTSLNRLNSSGWIVLDCGRGLSRSSTVAGTGSFLVASW